MRQERQVRESLEQANKKIRTQTPQKQGTSRYTHPQDDLRHSLNLQRKIQQGQENKNKTSTRSQGKQPTTIKVNILRDDRVSTRTLNKNPRPLSPVVRLNKGDLLAEKEPGKEPFLHMKDDRMKINEPQSIDINPLDEDQNLDYE